MLTMHIYNTSLKMKNGDVYEIGKYIQIGTYLIRTRNGEERSENMYYLRDFHVAGNMDWAWISMNGRMKGATSEMNLCGPSIHEVADKIIICRNDAECVRRSSGFGRKPRYVITEGGYIWLPDFMRFMHPHEILRCLSTPGYAHDKSVHKDPPEQQFYPDWIPEENGFEIYKGVRP